MSRSGFLNKFFGQSIFRRATSSGGYSNSGARGKDFQKLMFSKKEKSFDLVLYFFLQKSW